MKLLDVTDLCKNDVSLVKQAMPEGCEVKIYEKGPVRYIHTFREDYNVVSISNLGRPVSEADWFYATEKFLKLDITDVEITITPREVVIIREKSESILRFAH